MEQLAQGILIALLPSLLVSVVTAWVTVRLSLREFRLRWWWERKADAYSRIVEQLSTMEFCLRGMWDDYVGSRVLQDEERTQLYHEYKSTRKELIKVAAAGAYIISKDTAAAMEELLSELGNGVSPDFVKQLNNEAQAQRECISKIRKLAREDLGTD